MEMGILPFGRKKKEKDEFEALIEANLDGLFGVAMRYTRDRALAEDLVHDTVVRALRFRDRFEMGTNFRAWVYTILTHTFIHKYRRQKREREILDGHTRQDVVNQLSSAQAQERIHKPENSYLHDLLSDDVLNALDTLPEEFRTVVVLCDIEGLSYKEIADVTACPVGTVMSRLYRGRRLLEQLLYNTAKEQGIVRESEADGDRLTQQGDGGGVVDFSSFKRRKQA